MSDIYLSLTETPTVVTLSQPVVSGVLSSNVTVTNVVSVNVVTMPAITVQAAAPAVTTVAGTVAVSNFPSVTTVAGTVALDANSLSALENVTVTVGAAVSVSNFPSTQTVAGTVTASLAPQAKGPVYEVDSLIPSDPKYMIMAGGLDYAGTQETRLLRTDGGGRVEVASIANSVTIGSIPAISGTVTAMGYNYDELLNDIVPIRNGPNDERYIPIGPSLNNAGDSIDIPISGTVTVGNSVTIGSLPAISGTVTANGFDFNNSTYNPIPIAPFDETVGGGKAVVAKVVDSSGNELNWSDGSVPISGTVTANLSNVVTADLFNAAQSVRVMGAGNDGVILQGVDVVLNSANIFEGGGIPVFPRDQSGNFPISGTVTVGNSVTIGSLPAISGTVTANLSDPTTSLISNQVEDALFGNDQLVNNLNQYLTLQNNVPISGTVTAVAPNGSLTTRFGTPTTANTAFATSAVTNANRKYLLIQNVTTGSNVITVGIGFTPTTTQGIQLTAGAGITFESSYIPTGAVYVLSSVTASNFTILEA